MALTEFGNQFKDRSQRASTERVPSPVSSLMFIRNGIGYEAHRITRENLWPMRKRFLPLEVRGFSYENPFTPQTRTKQNIKIDGEIVFARTLDEHPRDLGAMTMDLRIAMVEGQQVKFECVGIRVVLPECQGHDIGTELARVGIIIFDPDEITGITRTPRIPRANEKSGFIKKLRPIDEPLRLIDKVALMSILRDDERKKLYFNDWIYRGLLPYADEENFIPRSDDVRGNEIWGVMKEKLHIDAANGDAMRYADEVDKEASKEAARLFTITSNIPPVEPTPLLNAPQNAPLPGWVVAALRVQDFFLKPR